MKVRRVSKRGYAPVPRPAVLGTCGLASGKHLD
jgi:hypothetical protein